MPVTPSKLQREAARNIVTKYLKVRPGENAIIESWNHTLPMASAMVDEIRRVGGSVLLVYEDEDAWWRAMDRKQSKLLGKSSAPEWAALKAADVYVNFWGPGDTDRIEKDHRFGDERTFDQALSWNWPWYEVARKAGLRGGRMTGRSSRRVGPRSGAWTALSGRKALYGHVSSTRRNWPKKGPGSSRRSPAGRRCGSPIPTEPTWKSPWPG